MAIIRVNKDRGYSVISNEPIQDVNMSWESRGGMSYLLSKPDGWTCRPHDLVKQGTCGITKIRNMLKEMEQFGYLVRVRYRKPDGTFDWDAELYESRTQNPYLVETLNLISHIAKFQNKCLTSNLTTNGSSMHGQAERDKPIDIVSTELVSTELVSTKEKESSSSEKLYTEKETEDKNIVGTDTAQPQYKDCQEVISQNWENNETRAMVELERCDKQLVDDIRFMVMTELYKMPADVDYHMSANLTEFEVAKNGLLDELVALLTLKHGSNKDSKNGLDLAKVEFIVARGYIKAREILKVEVNLNCTFNGSRKELIRLVMRANRISLYQVNQDAKIPLNLQIDTVSDIFKYIASEISKKGTKEACNLNYISGIISNIERAGSLENHIENFKPKFKTSEPVEKFIHKTAPKNFDPSNALYREIAGKIGGNKGHATNQRLKRGWLKLLTENDDSEFWEWGKEVAYNSNSFEEWLQFMSDTEAYQYWCGGGFTQGKSVVPEPVQSVQSVKDDTHISDDEWLEQFKGDDGMLDLESMMLGGK